MLVLHAAVVALIEGLRGSPLRDFGVGALLVLEPSDCDDVGIEWAPRRRVPLYDTDMDETRLTQGEALRQLHIVQAFVEQEITTRFSMRNQTKRYAKALEVADILLVGEDREPLSLLKGDLRGAWRFRKTFRRAVETARTLIEAPPYDDHEGRAHV